jgi:hypothetical protein
MKNFLISIAALLAAFSTMAQLPANRSVKTVVADALAQLPAINSQINDELMKNLAATGEEGVLNIVSLLELDGSKQQAELALRGITAYVSAQGTDEERQKMADAYRKALNTTGVQTVKDLLNEQLVALETADSQTNTITSKTFSTKTVKKYLPPLYKTPETLEKEGFMKIFNGRDLKGWKGLVENPIVRAKMTPKALKKAQKKADKLMRKDWKVEDGMLVYVGSGYDNICTDAQYGDFEMYLEWKLDPASSEADAGVYLRGTPQVQIWDISRTNVGAEVGSGGLYNNKTNPSKPLKVADKPLGEWNTMFIRMIGDRVTVYLNGELVTDNIILENYWDREQPIFPRGEIELQAHGSKVWYRNIYIKESESPKPFELSEQEKAEGYKILFDGSNMFQWTGNLVDYQLENGTISVHPTSSFGGNLYTKNEYSNFVFRFEFCLTPSANNGVGIRAPMEGDNAYNAMEIQILDCEHPIYSDIEPYQHHGSVYGVIAAGHGAMKPVGEWNEEEILADGDHIRVTLNGKVILDGNIREASKNGTIDHQEHPGLFNKSGHIGFLGHGSELKFRNIRIKELSD